MRDGRPGGRFRRGSIQGGRAGSAGGVLADGGILGRFIWQWNPWPVHLADDAGPPWFRHRDRRNYNTYKKLYPILERKRRRDTSSRWWRKRRGHKELRQIRRGEKTLEFENAGKSHQGRKDNPVVVSVPRRKLLQLISSTSRFSRIRAFFRVEVASVRC